MKTFSTFMLILALSVKSQAQCTASGPRNPSESYGVFALGKVGWFNTHNIFTSGNVHTISTALLLGDSTQTLVAKGFGFNIPTSAAICGIKVEVEKSRDGLKDNVRDGFVKLVKSGNIVGANRRIAAKWPRNDSIIAYGGPTDLWGTSWTAEQVNSPNFGMALSASLKTDLTAWEFLNLPILPIAKIDHISITIYYSDPLPVELLDFKAVCPENTVILSWTVASQNANAFFTVERSENGIDYVEVGKLDGAGTSNLALDYTFSDPEDVLNEILYYRLKQTDFNGNAHYFDPVTIECDKPAVLVVYPNPASDVFNIFVNREANKSYSIGIYDSYGFEVRRIDAVSSNTIPMERENLPSGMYIVTLESNGLVLKAEKFVLK